jgi:hypothetical protein
MSLSQSLSGPEGLKLRLMTLGLTGSLWLESVVTLNLRFVFERIPISFISRSTHVSLH